ncbi:MAG: hypothetical protein MUF08_01085, partial [Burkholderiaceae bacterium]|nr:hypothetical protein [Burkholderiaceae bacterium]
RKMSSGNIALAIWEDLMESRLYGPGRHQSFPVIGSVSFLVRPASSKVQSGKCRRRCRKAVQFPKNVQDAFQPPTGALITIMVI